MLRPTQEKAKSVGGSISRSALGVEAQQVIPSQAEVLMGGTDPILP